jgi:hypothetical protein
MGFKQEIIKEFGLKRADDLEEIVKSHSFIFDTNYGSETDGNELAIYPVTRKIHLTHDLLCLYGTHWRYLMQEDWTLKKEDGDVDTVLDCLKKGKTTHRFAKYAFTRKYLDEHKSLYICVLNTFGWNYHMKLLSPMFRQDAVDYEEMKRKIN